MVYVVELHPPTGTASCRVCKERLQVGELRVGYRKMIWHNGRVGEAGSKMVYVHPHCLKLDSKERLTPSRRESALVSKLKTKFQGFDKLSSNHQALVRELALNGKLPKRPKQMTAVTTNGKEEKKPKNGRKRPAGGSEAASSANDENETHKTLVKYLNNNNKKKAKHAAPSFD
uniref:PARP-type domain-containing protein n=1 Tax=Lotharella oceanica TaxID=641309 RepID=A0A7S2TXP7_9EUKA|mmetsp:Transcript_31853/g.59366  ORF Transcript_31853/g.59366 Transcript_31853/m.59366 type:complete len:173 (+) Transcript_31853:75-593(+)